MPQPAIPSLQQVQAIQIKDFTYPLPPHRIAEFPLPQRDASKLLVYAGGNIRERVFHQLDGELPAGALLVMNNTRVVPARLLFQTGGGHGVEVFCLSPLSPVKEVASAMQTRGHCRWQCLVGNNRRWPDGEELVLLDPADDGFALHARRAQKLEEGFGIDLRWTPPQLPFADMLERVGKVPLPPYIKRAATDADLVTYQTVYAQQAGAVAAPTAGLHFTPNVLANLAAKNIGTEHLTLHVGAGTFKPVTAQQLRDHAMHSEEIIIRRQTVQHVAANLGRIVAVGTTSMRTLESLYWFGARLLRRPAEVPERIYVGQWEPYEGNALVPAREALGAVDAWMQRMGYEAVGGDTQLIIVPGYPFQVCDGLITNFHQPESTLLLLIAAFIGEDWRTVYDYALGHDFRFLSYGDSSLLWRTKP
jgi:S-adenosylmethionine:tRNA ribosyltransferase-isomerase